MKKIKAICIGLFMAFSATAAAAAPVPTTAKVETGVLQGHVVDGVLSFKGFPYASPPTGDLRWRAPQPAKPLKGVFDASAFGHDCVQSLLDTALAPILTEPSEDCLVMNVWRPAEASPKKLPVMVWIYGGGLTRGGSSSTVYGGESFAKQGIVMVSFNYRVGRLGFFAFPALTREHPEEPKGNYGFMDQIAALKWVQRNIAAFGGDPNNVTIVGQSAGARSVHEMVTSPLARGLFNRAIVQSGSAPRYEASLHYLTKNLPNNPSMETIGANFARSKGIAGTDDVALKKLRALSSAQVAELSGGGEEGGADQNAVWGGFGIDGKLVVESAADAYRLGHQAKVPLMIGTVTADNGGARAKTMDEALARFGARKDEARKLYDPENTGDAADVARKVGMDASQIEPARYVATTLASQGIPAYEYRYNYQTEALASRWNKGTPHAGELAYTFNTVAPYYGPAVSPRDRKEAQMANSYWANFVKTGDPNGAGLANWPKYSPSADTLLMFNPDGTAAAIPDPWKPRLDLAATVADASAQD